MLWTVRFAIKSIFRLLPLVVAALVGAGTALLLQLRGEQRAWGLDPADAERPLAGDDLVVTPGIVDTRSLVIDAPPADVWPWLAQLGFGRGGWYSYDRMDMAGSSADRILPEFQDLAPGDLVPTHPGGGFLAKVVEPGRALVLYLDDQLARSQAESAGSRRSPRRSGGCWRAGARRPPRRGGHGRPDHAAVPGQLGVRARARVGGSAHPAHRAFPGLGAGCRPARAAGDARHGPGGLRHDPQAHAGPQGARRASLEAARLSGLTVLMAGWASPPACPVAG